MNIKSLCRMIEIKVAFKFHTALAADSIRKEGTYNMFVTEQMNLN